MIRIRYILLFLFLLLLAYTSPGQQPDKARAVFIVAGNNGVREINDDFIYNIELFPGQEFTGYIYHWPGEGEIAYGDFHENPAVDWLSVSPASFTAIGCEEPVPVAFRFKAPLQAGKYTTTVEDYEYNWSDNVITLQVTERPDSNVTDSMIIVSGQANTYHRYQEHRYTGIDIDQSWYDIGYCGTDPYIFSPTRKITRAVRPSGAGITFFPETIILNLDEPQVVTKTFQLDQNSPDSIYEAIYPEWKSYPVYIKWKFVIADEYCLEWEHIPSLTHPCLAAGAATYRDSLFVIGGFDPYLQAPLGRVETLREHSWKQKPAELNEPRYGFACGVLDDRIYIFGGLDGNQQALNTVEYYDGSQWQTDTDTMPVPLSFHSGAGYGDSYYIFGGKSGPGQTFNNSLLRYSRQKGWRVLHDSLPFSPRERYGCLETDKFIYIIGGVYCPEDSGDSTWFSEVYMYDIVADTFSVISPMNHPRADFACGLTGGFIYVVGGTSSEPGIAASMEFLDPVSGMWFSCEDVPDLFVVSPAFAVVDDHLFLIGGSVSLPGSGPDYKSCYGSDFLSGDGSEEETEPLEMLAFPNPFLYDAFISILLPYDSRVRLTLYDVCGRLVTVIADESLQAGDYEFFIDGSPLSEGLYFVELKTDKHHLVRKMVKVRE